MGFNFFEPLTQFYGLLRKTTPFLCLFGTVNINKAVLPNKTILLPCFIISDLVWRYNSVTISVCGIN